MVKVSIPAACPAANAKDGAINVQFTIHNAQCTISLYLDDFIKNYISNPKEKTPSLQSEYLLQSNNGGWVELLMHSN